MRARLPAKVAIAATVVIVSCAAQASEFSAQLNAAYRHSDNVDEQPIAAASNAYDVGARLSWVEKTSSLDAGADGDVLYRKFSNDAFSPETITRLRAAALWTISENRFYFLVQENEGQYGIGSRLSFDQSGLERMNVLTVGPDGFVGLGDDVRLRMSARYSNIQYQRSDLDGARYKGEVSLERSLASSSIAALSVFATKSTFDNSSIESNSTAGATVGYSTHRRRTTFEAVLGVQSLQLTSGSTTGTYGRLELDRLISPRSTLLFAATTRVGDASDALVFGQTTGPDLGDVVAGQARAVPARQTDLSAKYELAGQKVFLTAAVGWFRERAVNGSGLSDVDARSLLVTLGYRFTPAIAGSVVGIEQREGVPTVTQPYSRNRSLAAELEWRLTRTFSLKLRGERLSFDGGPTGFDENRYALMAAWDVYARNRSTPDPNLRLRARRGAAMEY